MMNEFFFAVDVIGTFLSLVSIIYGLHVTQKQWEAEQRIAGQQHRWQSASAAVSVPTISVSADAAIEPDSPAHSTARAGKRPDRQSGLVHQLPGSFALKLCDSSSLRRHGWISGTDRGAGAARRNGGTTGSCRS